MSQESSEAGLEVNGSRDLGSLGKKERAGQSAWRKGPSKTTPEGPRGIGACRPEQAKLWEKGAEAVSSAAKIPHSSGHGICSNTVENRLQQIFPV